MSTKIAKESDSKVLRTEADSMDELMKGFSKLDRPQRLQRLLKMGVLTSDDVKYLKNGGGLIDPDLGDHFIENTIGYFQMPLGVATNFRINGEDYIIPMAVEETSIIAAASKTAKWVRENGEIQTRILGKNIIGQIQIARALDFEKSFQILSERKAELIEIGNKIAESMVRRGGGIRDIEFRKVSRGENQAGDMLVIHVLADPCDAMGANIINQVCEGLKPHVEAWTGERVSMCILSNLVDTKLTESKVIFKNIDPDIGLGIEEASLFAQQDPYRAATNNKGVLNGMDAVLLATGNDWRAVEAGVHAYAARSGQYRSITKWVMEGKDLVGTLIAPVVVGIVGGVTTLHPTAKMCLRLLKIKSAEHLSQIVATVGLIQNLGALRALSTVGIVEGHMRLHTTNLAIAAGAQTEEIPIVQNALEEILKNRRRISLNQAMEVLAALRTKKEQLNDQAILA